jgi:hypothetical protein
MQSEHFQGPKLKIARGRRHAAEFKTELAAYLKDDPAALFLQVNRSTGHHRVTFKTRKSIPGELSTIFGDAVHNFRTALDILANDLVSHSGEKPEKVYFPFWKDAAGFENELKVKMGKAKSDIQDIVRSFKPYVVGGNETLRAMHDLDIGDKHIAIMQIGTNAMTGVLPLKQTESRPLPQGSGELSFEVDVPAIPVVKIDLAGFPADDPDIETLGKFAGSELICVIANGFPLANTPVVKALNKIGDVAQSIVKTFETHCFG